MKSKKIVPFILAMLFSVSLLTACGSGSAFTNPGDSLGGGGTVSSSPSESSSENVGEVSSALPETASTDITEVPEDAVEISEKKDNLTIEQSGVYYLTGEINDKIEITAEGVTLYLNNATLTNGKKVIDSACSLTITLIGENYICNTNSDSVIRWFESSYPSHFRAKSGKNCLI